MFFSFGDIKVFAYKSITKKWHNFSEYVLKNVYFTRNCKETSIFKFAKKRPKQKRRKRKTTRYIFSRHFRKHVPLATDMWIYKKIEMIDLKGMGAAPKRKTHKRYHGKTERVYNVRHHAVGIVVNKQVKARILAKKTKTKITPHTPQKNI